MCVWPLKAFLDGLRVRPDVVTVDPNGITITRMSRENKHQPMSFTIRWNTIEHIAVEGGTRTDPKTRGPRRHADGSLLEEGPETELIVRFREGHAPSQKWLDTYQASQRNDGTYRIYGPSKNTPSALQTNRLRPALTQFADLYDNPNHAPNPWDKCLRRRVRATLHAGLPRAG
ncbi:hypothetical protein [Actinoallomurus acaciae]|uniref:Uncharacterized protein n=1 Tax=Actinoallomurus acaciae TaxID=502577 RepID=A0ABV5YND9_9ACTN